MNSNDFLTTKQAAEALKCDMNHVRYLVRRWVIHEIVVSERKRYYRRVHIEKRADEIERKFERAA